MYNYPYCVIFPDVKRCRMTVMFYILKFKPECHIDGIFYVMDAPMESKQFVRSKLLVARRALSEDAWLAMSAAVVSEALKINEVTRAKCVMAYLSIASSREVATDELCRKLHEAGKRITVPAVIADCLVPVDYLPGEPLIAGIFGQPEPVRRTPVDSAELDAILLPVVGIDSSGRRMGYGKGYYDRFLSELAASGMNPCRIGLAFSLQFLRHLPADPWDEALDYAVHESGAVRFN